MLLAVLRIDLAAKPKFYRRLDASNTLADTSSSSVDK